MYKFVALALLAVLASAALSPMALACPQGKEGNGGKCKKCTVITTPKQIVVTIVKRPLRKRIKIYVINESKLLKELKELRKEKVIKLIGNLTEIKKFLKGGYIISEITPLMKLYRKGTRIFINVTALVITLRKGLKCVTAILDLIKGKLYLIKPLIPRVLTLSEVKNIALKLINMTIPPHTFTIKIPSIVVNVTSININVTLLPKG